jgi:hypothetical protein
MRGYGVRPKENNSHKKIEKLQTSELKPNTFPFRDSGAVHFILTLFPLRKIRNDLGVSIVTERPKSLSFAILLLSNKTLLAHKSQ